MKSKSSGSACVCHPAEESLPAFPPSSGGITNDTITPNTAPLCPTYSWSAAVASLHSQHFPHVSSHTHTQSADMSFVKPGASLLGLQHESTLTLMRDPQK